MEWYEKELVKDVREAYNTPLTDEELVFLYSQYSEEKWSASGEDNVEGLFIEWLKEKENKNDT